MVITAKKQNKKFDYICNACGTIHLKWIGKCEGCHEWNTIVEEERITSQPTHSSRIEYNDSALQILPHVKEEDLEITATHMNEVDRVLGKGIVSSSAILIGGEPGIGKSTLLLQISQSIAIQKKHVLYITGEEAASQIKMRADRLSVNSENIAVAMSTELRSIKSIIESHNPEATLVIIDSIQTLYHSEINSAPGTVIQIRTAALELINMAKARGFSLILVGHVTKEGQIAGPKILEHMVDVVLYFESEKEQKYRIIRGIKNRYGPANEIGIFEMTSSGLAEVNNPSTIFLPAAQDNTSGSSIFAGLQGSRLIFNEIQALITPTFLANPRRAIVGWDSNRLAMIIAILNARMKIKLLDKEIYLNVVGGLKISDPGADLAVVAALVSAANSIVITRKCLFIGEVGLSGEVRQVQSLSHRLIESEKLGFEYAIVPRFNSSKEKECLPGKMKIHEISTIHELVPAIMSI